MKTDCNENLELKNVERSEQAKKIYRYVSDVARRLGEATITSKELADLFTIHIEVQRQKLRDNCEKLFFLDPLNYGKKAVELLWRKVYYDTISTAKKLRESDTKYDNNIEMLIRCGIGHFHHFITKLQSEKKIKIKELDYTPLYIDEENQDDLDYRCPEDENQLYKSILYSCLIYLGDLSRYQVEIFNNCDPSMASRYYLQAAQLDLTSGMPFNQLGNLYLEKNYNLDSVSSYIHCLSCLVPFEGAMGNLNKIFEKNNVFCSMLTEPESLSQSEHIQITLANFLSLIEKWYFNKDDANIPKLCSTVVQQLKIAMDFPRALLPDKNKNYTEYIQALEEENANPTYLNSTMIHNIVKICLFTIAKLKENNENKSFACKAFTLAFLSQILQRLHSQLENLGFKNPAIYYVPKYNVKQPEVMENGVTDSNTKLDTDETTIMNGNKDEEKLNEDELIKGDGKNYIVVENGDLKKKVTTRRRRRRRLASSGSSDLSNNSESSDEESDQTTSEDDDDISETSDEQSEDEKSDVSALEDTDNEVEEKTVSPDIMKSGNKEDHKALNNSPEQKTDFENNKKQNEDLNVQGIKNFLLGDNILPSLKLLQDWVLTEKELILSCGDSGESLFQCVVNLLNIFQHYFNQKNNDLLIQNNCAVLLKAKNIAKKFKLEYKSIPLPEDINLRGTNIGKFDKDAAEWQKMEKLKLTEYEENIIRILNFTDFGNQIAKIVPRIKFNRTMKIFYLKKVFPPKVSTKLNQKRTREWHNSTKQVKVDKNESGLLRRLGHLWLTSRVRELENTGQVEAPSLLALDTAALYKHLRRVKQLLKTRNFIFLVPSVVLQELDDLKRECSAARDAIRWLETQLKSGSRFLRTQRPGQSKPLPFLKYPRKAPSHVHNFMQILEFCNHFSDEKQQGGNGDPENTTQVKSAPLLVLLVGNEPGKHEDDQKEFSLLGTAQAAGICVEYIGDFYTKWRQTSHKNGKKR